MPLSLQITTAAENPEKKNETQNTAHRRGHSDPHIRNLQEEYCNPPCVGSKPYTLCPPSGEPKTTSDCQPGTLCTHQLVALPAGLRPVPK